MKCLTSLSEERKNVETSPMDDFLSQLGQPGRFQLFVYFILCTTMFPVSFHSNMMIFMGVVPPHHCKLPSSWNWTLNDSIPTVVKNGVGERDRCHLYVNPSNQSEGIMPCPVGWDYQSDAEWSIVPEWNLVCDEEYKVSLATTMFFAGLTVGSLFFGTAADRIGRRPLVLFSLYSQLFFSIAIAFTSSYAAFISLRFILGVSIQGLTILTVTLAIELFPMRMRTLVGLFFGVIWALALGIQTWVAFHLRYWRHIQLALSLPGVISFVYFWFIPESLRWLMSQKKLKEAQSVSLKFIRFNQIPTPTKLQQQLGELSRSLQIGSTSVHRKRPLAFFDLFQTRKLSVITAIVLPCCFGSLLGYHGLGHLMSDLQENFYVNVVIGAAIEVIGLVMLLPSMDRLGRRFMLMFSLMSSGLVCLCMVVVVVVFDTAIDSLVIVGLAVTGKVLSNNAFNCLCVYGNELFPTVVRSVGMSMSIFWSRASGIASPQLLYLGHVLWKPLPFLVFAIVNLLVGSIAYFLPETLRKPLPDSLDDVEKLWSTTGNDVETVTRKPSFSISTISSVEGLF